MFVRVDAQRVGVNTASFPVFLSHIVRNRVITYLYSYVLVIHIRFNCLATKKRLWFYTVTVGAEPANGRTLRPFGVNKLIILIRCLLNNWIDSNTLLIWLSPIKLRNLEVPRNAENFIRIAQDSRYGAFSPHLVWRSEPIRTSTDGMIFGVEEHIDVQRVSEKAQNHLD